MPLYYFKLVDSRIVSDHGVHQLADESEARKAAIELTRPNQRMSEMRCLVPVRQAKRKRLSNERGLSSVPFFLGQRR
jgi:hypothetical protein